MQEGDPDAIQALKEGDAEAEKTMAAMEKAEKTYDPNDPAEEEVEAAEGEFLSRRSAFSGVTTTEGCVPEGWVPCLQPV